MMVLVVNGRNTDGSSSEMHRKGSQDQGTAKAPAEPGDVRRPSAAAGDE